MEETKRELRMPWGAGIAGFVADKGQTVNVPDVYQVRTGSVYVGVYLESSDVYVGWTVGSC